MSDTDITGDDVRRLARFARLQLTSEEISAFVVQLREILTFARTIQSVDTSGVDSLSAPSSSAVRQDEPQPSLGRETAISGAAEADPDTGLFKVPRVLGA